VFPHCADCLTFQLGRYLQPDRTGAGAQITRHALAPDRLLLPYLKGGKIISTGSARKPYMYLTSKCGTVGLRRSRTKPARAVRSQSVLGRGFSNLDRMELETRNGGVIWAVSRALRGAYNASNRLDGSRARLTACVVHVGPLESPFSLPGASASAVARRRDGKGLNGIYLTRPWESRLRSDVSNGRRDEMNRVDHAGRISESRLLLKPVRRLRSRPG